jgi:hypothetical protein
MHKLNPTPIPSSCSIILGVSRLIVSTTFPEPENVVMPIAYFSFSFRVLPTIFTFVIRDPAVDVRVRVNLETRSHTQIISRAVPFGRVRFAVLTVETTNAPDSVGAVRKAWTLGRAVDRHCLHGSFEEVYKLLTSEKNHFEWILDR